MTQCVAFDVRFRHTLYSSTQLNKTFSRGTYVVDVQGHESNSVSKAAKRSKKAEVPSVLEMMKTDTELKDFYRLIQENGYREQAVTLLRDRLQARRPSSTPTNLPS
jgi:hypothetical protein